MEETETQEKQFEPLSLGTLIAGRYEIESQLGVGSMGCVYLAKDRVLGDELIALKILHSEFAHSPTYAQRFLREVQLMRRLSHENIVRTFDVGADKDLVYFTMEFIRGQSLDKLISDKEFSGEEIAKLIIQICRGLEAIHAVNVIHRDLKPANIIITEDGVAKITDFGVARPEVSKLTGHNEVVGSAGYMAPEVWLGRKVTPAVDLYSLGVVVFEITTGTLPFDAESPGALMRLHLDRHALPIRSIKPEAPLWLNKLVIRLLAKSPQDRPRTAREVIEYLETHATQRSANTETPAGENIKSAVDESTSLLAKLEELSKSATATGQLPERGSKPAESRKVSNQTSATREILSTLIEFSRASSSQVVERLSPMISRHVQCVASTFCMQLILLVMLSYWVTKVIGSGNGVFLLLTAGSNPAQGATDLVLGTTVRTICGVFLLYAFTLSVPLSLALAFSGQLRVAFRVFRTALPLTFAGAWVILGWWILKSTEGTTPAQLVSSAVMARQNLSELLLLSPAVTTLPTILPPPESLEQSVALTPLYNDLGLLCFSFATIMLLTRGIVRGVRKAIGGKTTAAPILAFGLFSLLLCESAIVTTQGVTFQSGLVPLQILALHLVLSLPALSWSVFNWLVVFLGTIYLVIEARIDQKTRDS